MDKNYHIIHNGVLTRDENTIRFDRSDGEITRIPVRKVEALFCYGQVDYNTEFVQLLDEYGIELHIFGWNDQYLATLSPSRQQISGETIVEQVRAYDNFSSRISIASEIVLGSIHNMKRNVAYYESRGHSLSEAYDKLIEQESIIKNERQKDIEELLGVEAQARKAYYSSFDDILQGLNFTSRRYNPPSSESNALISFCNSLVYANCTSAINQTALEPSVSYLHAPGKRRNSLALDLADIFKPVVADRVMFRVVNRQQVGEDDFRDNVDGFLLTETGRTTVLKEYEEMLRQTVKHPELGRNVSYKYLMRLEAYKLKKSILGGKEYDSFRRWW